MAQKHLGLTLDEKLSLNNYINDKINETWKSVGFLRKHKHAITTAKLA